MVDLSLLTILLVIFSILGDLHVSWHVGRELFRKYLLDADWAINTFWWHWTMCSSFFQKSRESIFDAPNYFKKFDPHGSFIREYVPELKKFPTDYIYEPWDAPKQVQKRSGCKIGVDYPNPCGGTDGIHIYGGNHTCRPQKRR